MARKLTTAINQSQCIGDSLQTINVNFENLDTGVQQLSTNVQQLSSDLDNYYQRIFTYKNKVINGNFDVWQRGTSLTSGTGGRYLADRWSNHSVGSTYTVSRQAFTLGQTSVPGEPQYFHRTVVTSVAGANNYASLTQNIEDVRTFAGKTVTVSFWAKTAAGTKQICATVSQDFGTGGSPSVRVQNPHTSNFTLTTTWQKFTFTIAVPSIAGKTFGTNNDSYLILGWWFDAGSNWSSATNSLGPQSGTFDIAQVQIEEGLVATTFEQRPIGTELALCQRYYEKSYNLNTVPGTPGAGASIQFMSTIYSTDFSRINFYHNVRFKIRKRTTPVVDIYSPSSLAGTKLNRLWIAKGSPITSQFDIAPTAVAQDEDGVVVNGGDYVLANPYIGFFHYTADAEL